MGSPHRYESMTGRPRDRAPASAAAAPPSRPVAAALALLLLAVLPAAAAPSAETAGVAPTRHLARNIIICVADGGGFNQYAAGSYYEFGRLGQQVYEQPGWVQLASRTLSLDHPTVFRTAYTNDVVIEYDPAKAWDVDLDRRAGGRPSKGYEFLLNKPTDSASSATAMAMGLKAINGRINYVFGPDNKEGPAVGRSIAEIAKAMGKSAGVVSSVQWNDATPACFGGAHEQGRGSRRNIANEMLASDTLDVIMGGEHPEYDQNGAPRLRPREVDYDIAGGSLTWAALKSGTHARRWKLIDGKAQFEALASTYAQPPILGIARVTNCLQSERQTRDWNGDGRIDSSDYKLAPAYKDPFVPTVPKLETMARGALNVLSRNPKGFFLMVEGGAVDKAAHANHPGRVIEEQVAFNHMLRAVADWVERYSSWDETLVIVTADHETGLLLGVNSDTIPFDRVLNRGPGRMPALGFNSGGHSNHLVPIRARGPGAKLFETAVLGADPVRGAYVDNTTIFDVMNAAITGGPLEPVARISATAPFEGPDAARPPTRSTGNGGASSAPTAATTKSNTGSGTNANAGADNAGSMPSQPFRVPSAGELTGELLRPATTQPKRNNKDK